MADQALNRRTMALNRDDLRDRAVTDIEDGGGCTEAWEALSERAHNVDQVSRREALGAGALALSPIGRVLPSGLGIGASDRERDDDEPAYWELAPGQAREQYGRFARTEHFPPRRDGHRGFDRAAAGRPLSDRRVGTPVNRRETQGRCSIQRALEFTRSGAARL